jgi:hypothetical protein
MSSAPQIALDFTAPRARLTLIGALLLVIGMTALAVATLQYRSVSLKRAAVEMRLAEVQRRSQRDPAAIAHAEQLGVEATGVTRELGTPWTQVLADLELAARASVGQISLLAIEPDHEKHRIFIKAESKDLPQALEYLKRLQKSSSLLFPMLESHEVAADDKDRPVRFSMTADWREAP